MTKLAQIIDGATSDDVSISSLLRMVKVVAARLEADQLIAWVDHELGGYGKEDPLPAYRGPHPTEVMGVFVGPFNSTLTLAVPRVQLPQRVQDAPEAFVVCFRQPVSELEPLSKATDQLQSAWPAEWVSYINGAIDRGEIELVRMHHLQRAYQTITPPEIRGVLDAVRTRVLDLALALEKLNPAAGEPEAIV
ncbi:MAG: hypothetical protein JWM93_1072, partial [Frankiales bacterium]|nr:hypothetical protein [Frankiales bacterium]